jgi:hypothetical protein
LAVQEENENEAADLSSSLEIVATSKQASLNAKIDKKKNDDDEDDDDDNLYDSEDDEDDEDEEENDDDDD